MQQKNDVQKLCEDVLDFGDLLLIASKSHGKTESLKTLAKELKAMPNTRVFIFETFPKFIHEFDALPYFVVNDCDIVQTEHVVDLEDFFIRHERTYTIRRGKEIKAFLKQNPHGIFLLNVRDIERTAFFIYSIVNHFYRKNYLRAYKYGLNSITDRVVFIVEESQNVFDSSTISKKLFNRMRKIYSEARNMKLHFLMCSQRLQDLNSRIRARSRLLIGRISLDDYQLKFSRLLKNSKFREDVLTLPKGTFLYPSRDCLISFPRFKQESEPFQWQYKQPIPEPQPQPKKASRLRRFLATFKLHEDENEFEDLDEIDSEEEEIDFPILDEEF